MLQRLKLDRSDLPKMALLFVIYVLTAELGLNLGAVSGFATLVWPPTGLALAALFLFGRRLWPAVFLAALAVNYGKGAPLPVACGIALGNTLEALLGAALFRREAGSRTAALERVREVFALVALASILSTLVSATTGVASLYFGGVISSDAILPTWRAWWIGDELSDLVVAPLLLVWSQWPRAELHAAKVAEGILLGASAFALSLLIFGPWMNSGAGQYLLPYLILPLLIWTTLRFGQHANTVFVLALSVIAIWGTVRGLGPFQADSLPNRLAALQLFIAAVALAGLFFGAIGREKEEALQIRNEFISVASHELNTPLTSVILQIQMVKREMSRGLELPPDKVKKLVESLDRQLGRLAKLVEDLLDVSRIQSRRLRLEPVSVNLSDLISEVVERFDAQIREAGCTLETHLEPSVPGNWDRQRLEQVVINLLTNAAKYGRGKPITITVVQQKHLAVLTVQDHGIGIAPEDRVRIFERFERVQPVRDIGGLGLGLYIAKQIVEAHRGSIHVESELERGSTFRVELPLA